MSSAEVRIDLAKITDNARRVRETCAGCGVEVVGVTKGVCGFPPIARAMLEGGIRTLADARLDNIARMREAGISAPMLLLRSPAPSEVGRCISLADASLNGSMDVLHLLDGEASRAGKRHGVILMVDLRIGREGFLPQELSGVCREVAAMGSLDLRGLGLYFTQRHDPDGYASRLGEFVALARGVQTETGILLPILSGGSTNVFAALTLNDRRVEGINQLRIGTTILLGLASSYGPVLIEGLHHDTIVLSAELTEVKRRDRLVGILAFGRLDADPQFLFPVTPGARVLDATSDHTMVDLTDCPTPPRVGDRVSFELGYYAMSRLMMSPYVKVSTV